MDGGSSYLLSSKIFLLWRSFFTKNANGLWPLTTFYFRKWLLNYASCYKHTITECLYKIYAFENIQHLSVIVLKIIQIFMISFTKKGGFSRRLLVVDYWYLSRASVTILINWALFQIVIANNVCTRMYEYTNENMTYFPRPLFFDNFFAVERLSARKKVD